MRNSATFGFNTATAYRVLNLKSELDARAKLAKKAMLKTRQAVGNYVDTAATAVKRHPLKAVCATFGTAFIFGSAAGWLIKRNN
jgi:hypothetical protein